MKGIILTSQRSGSTFLKSCLDAHPQIRCYGELLVGGNLEPSRPVLGNRLMTKAYCYLAGRAWNPERIMDRYYGRKEAPVVLFKAMYNHADNRRVRKYLAEHEEIRVIHLRRDNLLKQHVSRMLIYEKRERPWQPHSTYRLPVVSVRIEPQRAISEMRRVRDTYNDFEQLLSRHRRIELKYEELFNGPTLSNDAWHAISELLEIEHADDATSNLVKINPNSLRPMVKNYDELAAALAETEFAKYLDDEPVEARLTAGLTATTVP
jgi:LPS sulfotransferase NodH